MLHAPDFLGYQDVVQLAKDHPDIARQGLELKKLGNQIVRLIGGREIHPINLKVGGFYRVPAKQELSSLLDPLKKARDAAYETVRWTSGLPFPDFRQDYEFVALKHPEEYAVIEGTLVSNKGLNIPISEFESYFLEEHVAHSTSLQAAIRERGAYMVGPLARINLNFDQLHPTAKEAMVEAGLEVPVLNPFQSIVVRSVEILHACEEALQLIEGYEMPAKPSVDFVPRAAIGYGCTEAPRGICWHRYQVSEDGSILSANIVPPTSQNQKIIEQDLVRYAQENIDFPSNELTWSCEQVVRNYDPCISCSCHVIELGAEEPSPVSF
jgi:coenzyme F420-reducing hydrogenase alpha subunit